MVATEIDGNVGEVVEEGVSGGVSRLPFVSSCCCINVDALIPQLHAFVDVECWTEIKGLCLSPSTSCD
jgi:hypothetical protein